MFLLGLVGGCGLKKYRLAKALYGRDQVLDLAFDPGPPLVQVQYRPGAEEAFFPYEFEADPNLGNLRPPRLFSKSAILLEVNPGINPQNLKMKIFVKSEPHHQNDLIEVRTIVSEIPGKLPNAVTFVEDLFPSHHRRLVLYPDDFTGPYQGIKLQSHDWIVIEIQSPKDTQKIVFEYVQTGLRFSTSAHLLFSTGVNLLDVGVAQIEEKEQVSLTPRRRSEEAAAPGQIDPGGLDLAVTFTAAVGYRGIDRYGPKRWLGDNLTLVFDIGVGNVGDIESILQEGTPTADRVNILQNQLLFGFGVQLFDFVSVHLLTNPVGFIPVRQGLDVEAVIIPEFGFDVPTALRFSNRLYERLFRSNVRRSYSGPPASLPSTRPALLVPPSSLPIEGAPLDESSALPI